MHYFTPILPQTIIIRDYIVGSYGHKWVLLGFLDFFSVISQELHRYRIGETHK